MKPFKKVHFIGVGGMGMFTLAGILLQRGISVSGSDLEESTKTAKLRSLGAQIAIGHRAENLPHDADLVVFSSAVKSDNEELLEAGRRGVENILRGRFLGELTRTYSQVIAVSGSHGKTTVTAMIAHLLQKQHLQAGFLVGGELASGSSFAAGDGSLFVTEVDESDGTHTCVRPTLGVVTNVDDDHSWSVGGLEQLLRNFADFAANSKNLLYVSGEKEHVLFSPLSHSVALPAPDDLPLPDNLHGVQRINAALALKALDLLGIHASPQDLADYPGVERRMTVRSQTPQRIILEDYAHHPTELAASLQMIRAQYPHHHLRVVFQPHRYARLSCYLNQFSQILRSADSCIIAPVFAAWNESGPVSSENLAQLIPHAIAPSGSWQQIATQINQLPPPSQPLLLAIIGAGDVNTLLQHL